MTTILVCGSRTFSDHAFLNKVLGNAPFPITTIVQGAATGADRLAGQFALDNCIPCCWHPANWTKHGKRAGYLRNAEMLEHHPDISRVIAFIDKSLPESKGTFMMVKLSLEANKQVFIADATDRSVFETQSITDFDI